jgi:flagellar hook protein FlgE
MGLGKETWILSGGTIGGEQKVDSLTGISIGANGTIVGAHPVHGVLVLGRIDLATFSNAKGLEQAGNSYFRQSENSGSPHYAIAGEDGSGA